MSELFTNAAQLLRSTKDLTPRKSAFPSGVFDLFKIGIGPSSSHTMGPMKAAAAFVSGIDAPKLEKINRIVVTTFGSLAWTGRGHGTDKALVLGLSGHLPHLIDPRRLEGQFDEICTTSRLLLPQGVSVEFHLDRDIVFNTDEVFRRHPNAMKFDARDKNGEILASQVWYSVGGGFIENDAGPVDQENHAPVSGISFCTSDDLLSFCRRHACSMAEVVAANELTRQSRETVIVELDKIVDAMMACIDRGLACEGLLPGKLRVKRRAKQLFQRLQTAQASNSKSPSESFEYISAFAIAVNEENAAGGRVVTAPTNGAAGVVPAVLRYYRDFCYNSDREGMRRFLLTAAAIGSIIKSNASISGAEVGCQGEVGSAAAMASAGLTAVLGGSTEQIENAAEIAIEHHLGMTCDPIGGLVQIPCIERNAFGAIKAVNAASLALAGDGVHKVSLDQVIEAMRQTGADMNDKYRETSRGGLAVNVPEC